MDVCTMNITFVIGNTEKVQQKKSTEPQRREPQTQKTSGRKSMQSREKLDPTCRVNQMVQAEINSLR